MEIAVFQRLSYLEVLLCRSGSVDQNGETFSCGRVAANMRSGETCPDLLTLCCGISSKLAYGRLGLWQVELSQQDCFREITGTKLCYLFEHFDIECLWLPARSEQDHA